MNIDHDVIMEEKVLFPKLPSQNWSYFTKIKAKY